MIDREFHCNTTKVIDSPYSNYRHVILEIIIHLQTTRARYLASEHAMFMFINTNSGVRATACEWRPAASAISNQQ